MNGTWTPERETVRLRNATVVSVSGKVVTLTLDGATLTGALYGPAPAANARVLVLEQGHSLLVLGNAVSLADRIEELEARIAALEERSGEWPR